MIAKPVHIFDRDDDWRALVDFASDQRPLATLGVVSGRRRQGKTYLLSALVGALDGFYFGAVEATGTESLRMFGAALAEHSGAPAGYSFPGWGEALTATLGLGRDRPTLMVFDELPYLMKADPAIPSLLQREMDAYASARRPAGRPRVLVCGSAMSVMGNLLSGTAPLRGRAGLELVVPPLGPVDAAAFWGITDPRLAVLLHAVVGGTPAYRREFVRDDVPGGPADFDAWVERTVLNPRTPLFREARYLLAEETGIRDPSLYHSVLAAIAGGNQTRGGIASYIGRKAADLSHPLSVLEDSALVVHEQDAFHSGRGRYRIAEPLLVLYQAIMRPHWRRLELGQAAAVWRDSRHRFAAQVVGPHFEALCREHALRAGGELFGAEPAEVLAGTVADPANRTRLEVDLVALGPGAAGQPRRIIALGEAKWGEVLGRRHLDRLARARDLLAAKGYDIRDTALVGFGGAGFDPRLADRPDRDRVRLIGLDQLYRT